MVDIQNGQDNIDLAQQPTTQNQEVESMAKKTAGVNKSEAIRNYLTDHPEAPPAEITEALKGKGIEVSPQMVSVIKGKWRKRQEGDNGQPTPRPTYTQPRLVDTLDADSISVSDVIVVRELVKKLGSENLKKLADALE